MEKNTQKMKFISIPGLITPKLPRIKFSVPSFQLYLVFIQSINVFDSLIVRECYRTLRMNYCKIFCCYRCQRQDWTTKSTTRLDLKEAVSSMIFSTQLSRQVQPVYFIKHEVSMYHIYIIYMIYEIYVIHLYIIWD